MTYFLVSCNSGSRPSESEALKQATTFINDFVVPPLIAPATPLRKLAVLKSLEISDYTPINNSITDVVYTAHYDVILGWVDTSPVQIGAGFLVGASAKKGPLNVVGIRLRFRKYDRRGWLLEGKPSHFGEQ